MSNLEKAKEIIKKHYRKAECGLFDTRNCVGDKMKTIYQDEDLQIDIALDYEYFEVFGLDCNEFDELEKYYNSLDGVVILPKTAEEWFEE